MRVTSALRFSVALVALAAGLSACGPHAASSSLPRMPAQTNPYNGDSGFIYNEPFMAGSRLIGPAKVDSMGFDVIVRLQNPTGLAAYSAGVSKPGSPEYRKFLTPEEV